MSLAWLVLSLSFADMASRAMAALIASDSERRVRMPSTRSSLSFATMNGGLNREFGAQGICHRPPASPPLFSSPDSPAVLVAVTKEQRQEVRMHKMADTGCIAEKQRKN
jgi:hypothetical protein